MTFEQWQENMKEKTARVELAKQELNNAALALHKFVGETLGVDLGQQNVPFDQLILAMSKVFEMKKAKSKK